MIFGSAWAFSKILMAAEGIGLRMTGVDDGFVMIQRCAGQKIFCPYIAGKTG